MMQQIDQLALPEPMLFNCLILGNTSVRKLFLLFLPRTFRPGKYGPWLASQVPATDSKGVTRLPPALIEVYFASYIETVIFLFCANGWSELIVDNYQTVQVVPQLKAQPK